MNSSQSGISFRSNLTINSPSRLASTLSQIKNQIDLKFMNTKEPIKAPKIDETIFAYKFISEENKENDLISRKYASIVFNKRQIPNTNTKNNGVKAINDLYRKIIDYSAKKEKQMVN